MNEQLGIDKLLESVNSSITGTVYDAYDYRMFFPGWEFVFNINYHSLIKNAFDVPENEVESFIGNQKWIYSSFVGNLRTMEIEMTVKVLRYALSLPMMDYQLLTSYPTPARGSVSDNKFFNSLGKFSFDKRCMREIKNGEVLQSVQNIISNSSLRSIWNSLGDLAFRKHKVLFRHLSDETAYKDIFSDYLAKPICNLLAEATGYGIEIAGLFNLEGYNSNSDIRSVVRPDLYLVLDIENNDDPTSFSTREVCCTIEVKPFPMIPYVFGPPQIGFEFFSMDRIPEYMKQAILQLTYHWINFGITTDAYTTCCFIIDLDLFENNKEFFYNSITNHGGRLIPMKYLLVNNFSSLPSIKESLLYHFFKSVDTFLQMDNRKERMRQFRIYLQTNSQELSHHGLSEIDSSGNESMFESQPDSSFSGESTSFRGHHDSSYSEPNLETVGELLEDILEVRADDDIYVQNGLRFNTQIFKIDAKYLKKYLVNEVNDEKKLVIKIYDYEISRMRDEATNSSEVREAILDSINGYRTESSILKELHEDKEFNSCYIPHNEGQILIKGDGKEIAGGRFNLLEFIDTIPLPKDLETYIKAKQQLDIIHKHGIIHKDIREENILFSKERVVYIIDFQYSSRDEHHTHSSMFSDIMALRKCFGLKDDI